MENLEYESIVWEHELSLLRRSSSVQCLCGTREMKICFLSYFSNIHESIML